MRKITYAAVATAALLLYSTPQAHAALVAYDGFETENIAALGGQSGGTGWSAGTWSAVSGVNVQAASLSYTGGAVSVNGGSQTAAILNDTNNNSAVSRSFPSQTGTVYFSFLFAAPAGLEETDFLSFQLNNDTNELSSAAIGMRNNMGNPFFTRLSTSGSATGTTVNSSINTDSLATFFLVGKLTKSATNYDRIDLFVNPTALTEPVSADATSSADSGIGTVSVFNIRSVNLDASDLYRFDEVRIGTSYADVVTAVPEPSSLILVGCGLAGLLVWRRLRS